MAPPTITGLSPNHGSTKGRAKVRIIGTGFSKVSKVWFGAKAGTRLKVKSSRVLTVIAPAQTSRSVGVRVVTRYGTSAVNEHTRFTYRAPSSPPKISGISPASGSTAGGTALRITGSNLAGTNKVTLGGVEATDVTVVSSTEVTAIAPPHAAGVADLVLSAAGGSATKSAAFTFSDAPVLLGSSAHSGALAGQTEVTLTGTGLQSASKVLFGDRPAEVVASTATSVRVLTPAHVAGTVDVVVVAPGGKSQDGLTFTFAAVPRAATSVEAEVLRLTNVARASARRCGNQNFPAVAPLSWDPVLGDLALAHSRDMESRNYFSHDTPEGESPFDRMRLAGYKFGAASENIAADTQPLPKSWPPGSPALAIAQT